MSGRTYTAFFPFCGIGGGALGFRSAEVRLLGTSARFRVIGGIDNDPGACRDFEKLTGAPALCTDIAGLTPGELRAFAGAEVPDVVFLSPPCKGASGLLSKEKSRSVKYQRMNQLAVSWTELMLRTWAEPPRLVLVENVPRLKHRAAAMVRKLRKLLRNAGYLLHDGFHECGELGGLAQLRKRWLLVARHADRVPPLLYQPPKKRVRACGEVLGELPMPGDPAGGPLHRLPRISWLNWVRLALIPAGGDWRDLPGVLEDGQKRREVFRRHKVQGWTEPADTVAGTGSNGPGAVQDPRLGPWYSTVYGVLPWDSASDTITGAAKVSSGRFAVADPRVAPSLGKHSNKMRVEDWEKPAHTVTTSDRIGSGAPSVADPRVRFGNVDRVLRWGQPAGTVTHSPAPSSGGGAVADPRVSRAFDHGYRVLPWTDPSFTIAGGSMPGQGAYSVGDPRVQCACRSGAYGVVPWTEAAKTVTGAAAIDNGSWAVADPRQPEAPPVIIIKDVRKPPSSVPVILAEDGTWHRPLTTLELAVLQGFPALIDGKPLELDGSSSIAWRERIGNAVPPPAAQAIAERMLVALVQADAEAFALDGGGEVWVEPERIGVCQ